MKLQDLYEKIAQLIKQGYGAWDICAEVNIGIGYDHICLYDVDGFEILTKGSHLRDYGNVSRNMIKLELD